MAILALVGAACNQQGSGGFTGTVEIDGSSTVFPITQAIAEEFTTGNPNVEVPVGSSGTGGGFEKFCSADESERTDISDASRPISGPDPEGETEEDKLGETGICETNGIEYVESYIAIDGLSVVANPSADFVDCLTTEELKKLFEPGSTVTNWSQIRAGFPNLPLKLYSPGSDSGTFDYFTDEINGEEGASRNDQEVITFSEDDNSLLRGVTADDGKSGRPLGLGYFGFSYYISNTEAVKALGVDAGQGCVEPTKQTVESGEYSPLSRPLFIYVAKAAAAREEVVAFVDFYFETVSSIIGDVGYVQVPSDDLEKEKKEWEDFAAST